MIKKIFVIMIAAVLMVSACAAPVYASPLDTVILPPDLGGFTDDMQDATSKYANGLRLIFKNVVDLLDGKKTVSEFIDDSYALTEEYGFGFLSDTLNAVDRNTITARELANIMTNALKKEIGNKGGSVSNFPLNDGGYWQVGIFTFKPLNFPSLNESFAAGFDALGPWDSQSQPSSGIAAYYPDGTRYKRSTYFRAFGSVGTMQSLSINNIEVLFKENVYVVFHYTIHYSDHGASRTYIGSDSILFSYQDQDWGVLDENNFVNITDTTDVDVLSDDDLIKYIDNLIKNLENAYPDLSTIEGKLQEIINKLDKLGGGGLDITDLLLALNTLVDLLGSFGDAADSLIPDELISILTDLLNTINQNGGTVSETDLTPVIDKIDELQKELLKAYAFDYSKDDIKAVTDKYDEFANYLIKKKFSFVTSLTEIINSALNTYAKSNETSFNVTYKGITREVQLGAGLSYDQLQLIRYMLAAFIYIRFAVSCYRRIPAYINNGGDK